MMKNYEEQRKEIETIKPREITLKLSDADCKRISLTAARYGLTVSELLENFIGDLVDGTYTNGSDERFYAQQYCERCWFSWHGNLLSHLRDEFNIRDFLLAWSEKELFEEAPEEYEEERMLLEEGEKLWFEETIDSYLKDWNPKYNIDMEKEIEILETWVAEREKLV